LGLARLAATGGQRHRHRGRRLLRQARSARPDRFASALTSFAWEPIGQGWVRVSQGWARIEPMMGPGSAEDRPRIGPGGVGPRLAIFRAKVPPSCARLLQPTGSTRWARQKRILAMRPTPILPPPVAPRRRRRRSWLLSLLGFGFASAVVMFVAVA